MLNKVLLQGKLGRDPEIRYTAGGTPVCRFSIASSSSYKDKQGNKQTKTYWATIIAWNKLAELCSQYLKKGQECIIVGQLQTNEWEKDGVKHRDTEVLASEMNFCGSAPRASQQPEDDIPF